MIFFVTMQEPVLHVIEKKIIKSLQENPEQSLEELAASAGQSLDQTRRGIEWLRHKKLVTITDRSDDTMVELGKNGLELPGSTLPERRLLNLLKDGPQPLPKVRDAMGSLFGAAMGIVKRNGWVVVVDGDNALSLTSVTPPALLPGESSLLSIKKGGGRVSARSLDKADLRELRRRPLFVRELRDRTAARIRLAGRAEQMRISDEEMSSCAIDVGADVPGTPLGRTHPLKEVISEIREIFVTMGFSEISGNVVQPCFWNFDALLTPQDHPSRDMQDTFYLDGDLAVGELGSPTHVERVGRTHADMWRQKWDLSEAKRMVLRTHTTCVTLRHLLLRSESLGDARAFSLGRVFRNEKTSYKHLAEFTQVEGVVHEKGSTIRDLMRIQTEFYRRLGLPRVKFWPTFFPYTEPSFQSMVYNERLGKWVELFGMGVFHPHVTAGLRHPVLAWGGGVERIAMLKYGVDDVREFYANNLRWLRSARPACR